MQIIPIWSVWSTIDEFGRHGEFIGHFSVRSAAEHSAKGRGWYAGWGNIVEGFAAEIDGKVYALASDQPIELNVDSAMQRRAEVDAARAKLSPRERQLLGLD